MSGQNQFVDDEPPPEPREGWLLVRIHVPELNVYKCLQFPSDKLVWDVKQQCLASLPKELKESFNYGLFCPPSNGKAGKFLDEERRLGDYPFNGPVGYLELKYKRRVYKMLNVDERQLKALHTRANLRRCLECIHGGHVEKVSKMCTKGLDPNFHCQESGETPLTLATATKKPNKLLIALVNGGALLDYRTKDGSTALHKAVERDCLEAVTTLLELGASPNYRDTKGLTAVYLSVTKKTDPKIVEALLHDHAVLGTQDTQGWQEVHQACRNGLVHHLEHLLFYGSDMDSRNASGNTPLHVCAVNNQEACARMLLFRGAQCGALNYANQTPYQVAVIAGNLELAEMIHSYKTDDIVPFRGPPRYNPRRRSGLGWAQFQLTDASPHATPTPLHHQLPLNRRLTGGPPSPCPSDHPFSSASSSLSESSSSHRSHEDDISIVTDKSLGDTSDIISDSSGVGTNSTDSAACSIGHPSTTVVCMEKYASTLAGHLNVQPGDVLEVVGSTDCGLLEGYVRGTSQTGFFAAHCVQEVQFRQKNGQPTNDKNRPDLLLSTERPKQPDVKSEVTASQTQYNSATAPRIKKNVMVSEARTVVLHRARRGFGFILRGAKASSPLMQLKPSPRCPALQYLDDVDPGGVADIAGLNPGDFLLTINGENVTCASHEHVVELIRASGSLVSMTVVTLPAGAFLENVAYINSHNNMSSSNSVNNVPNGVRQCATLPRRMSGPGSVKMPAPLPPRRDPRTTLSVGRARAKSMVAGLEGGTDGLDVGDDDLASQTKSSSVESLNMVTPTQTNPGTPTQPRTASIKARPSSSRITAAELEELFQRQQGADAATMMSSSHFQTGMEAPTSPKGPIVYASIADMKRKKTKMHGTLRGRPIAVPAIGGELRRTFHSSPDLAQPLGGSLNATTWALMFTTKTHRSQDDMHSLHMSSMQRLNLPPPTHPPPPPPVGQVVKVDVSRGEYDNTLALQKQIQQKMQQQTSVDSESMSSFRPSSNAKIYASPQDLIKAANARVAGEQANKIYKAPQPQDPPKPVAPSTVNPYAQPGIVGGVQSTKVHQYGEVTPAPPIPDPDYSLSESDGEGDSSVRLNVQLPAKKETVAETSGNSATSGSSTGSSSMVHSFSINEIQKIRTQLKSSKSYPNDFLAQQAKLAGGEGDSGVSSDQEVTVSSGHVSVTQISAPVVQKPVPPTTLKLQPKKPPAILPAESLSDDESPSPPLKGFQRQISLTRKQAAQIAANRAKASFLSQLPPPIEADADEIDHVAYFPEPIDIVAPPPPEFSDSQHQPRAQPQRSVRIVGAVPKVNVHQHHHHHHHQHRM